MFPIYSINHEGPYGSNVFPLSSKEGYLLAGLLIYGPMSPGELFDTITFICPNLLYIDVHFRLGDLWSQGWVVAFPILHLWVEETETANDETDTRTTDI